MHRGDSADRMQVRRGVGMVDDDVVTTLPTTEVQEERGVYQISWEGFQNLGQGAGWDGVGVGLGDDVICGGLMK